MTRLCVLGTPDARIARCLPRRVDRLVDEDVIRRLRGLPYVQQTDTTMLLSNLLSRPSPEPPGDPL